MKYKDINIDDARKCCKYFKKKCDKCPLRRVKIDIYGKKHELFCWFVMLQFYEGIEEEQEALRQEEIHYQKEWDEYIQKLETQEK